MTQPKMDERSKEAVTQREKALAEVEVLKAELAKAKSEIEATKSARTDSQRTEMSTVRREEEFELKDGPSLHMEVYGEIPGYHMHIVVDQDGDIERQLHRGYNFVEFGEVPTNSRKSFDASSDNRISWHSGTDESGQSYRSYLMKMENELWERYDNRRNADTNAQYAQLKGQALNNGEGRYVPAVGLNLQT
jgi:hypothetical protein